jgi:glycosyltransferase involved in cell wall biosynthesis
LLQKFLFLSSYAHLALDPEATEVSGGAELQVALLARELARRGHDAVIVGGDHGQKDGRILQGVRTRVGGKFQTGGLIDTVRALPRVLRIVAEEKPDYTLIRGWTTWLFFLQLARRRPGPRLVFSCGLDTEIDGTFRRENPVRGALFEYAVRRADGRFAMTDHQRALFQRAGLTCAQYRNLVPPRPAPRVGEKEVTFLWIARCQRIKRPQLFLDLAERHPEARCVMICPDEDRALWKIVERRAKTLPNVEFLRRVAYHEVQSYYDRAAIFVNTSEAEGFPNTFIQAALGGAAILSLSVDPDAVLTRYGAGLCAGGDEARFFAAATQLRNDAELLRRSQNQAARFVAELHDTEKNVNAFLAGLPAPIRR